MKNKSGQALFSILLAASVSLLLSACGNSAGEDLKQKIAQLEAENAGLKDQVTLLKDSLAKTKADELKRAIQEASNNSSERILLNFAESVAVSPAACVSTAAADNVVSQDLPAREFGDIDETPTKNMIIELAQLHVFDELGDKFQPNKAITRAEYIEWLYKAYNALEPESKQIRLAPQLSQSFKDMPPSLPQYKYVQALANAGFAIGYEDGTFKPAQPLTREEMLAIKVGVDVGKTLPPWRSQMEAVWKFSDSNDVAERYTGYLNQDFYVSGPHGSNIQRAFGKIGSLRPKQAVLRYEAAATLWQMGQFGDTQNTNVAAVLKERNNKHS